MRRLLIILAVTLLLALSGAALAESDACLSEYVIGNGYKIQLKGSVTAKDSVRAVIYNERTMENDADITVTAAENVSAINAKLLKIPMKSGEKQMILYSDGEEVYRAAFYVLGNPADCTNLISKCTITAVGEISRLTDGSIHSTLKIGKDGCKVTFPADIGSGKLVINWRNPPNDLTVHYYDTGLKEIGSVQRATGFYVDCIDFGENVGAIFFETNDTDGSLADVYVYALDSVPPPVQQWTEISSKLDILFVSTHQDDELLFFGGAIGYYSYAGKNTAVAYMADCGVKRYYEALNALWVLGVKNHPIFLGYSDFKAGSISEASYGWSRNKRDPLRDLVELYRKYQPDVVVCQDYNGEYGHWQHRYTAKLVTEAVEAAKDPSKYPDSYDKYGAWEVKKLYVHLYEENAIHIDWTALEVPGLGGINSLDLDKVAYDRHQSQLADFTVEKQGTKYDCGAFGLVYSAVGSDVLKNDFFENIGG